MNNQPAQFNLSFNVIVISAFLVLSLGVAAGSFGQKIYSQKTHASGCMSENNDVAIYAQHLVGILKGGGKISPRQMNTMLDLMEIRDNCEADWNDWKFTA